MTDFSFSSLVSQMSQGTFYPHAVTDPITLIKTHSAIIFLTGDYAYKIKKPVNFGFLDFSTLPRRKQFLEKELQLNQEISPEIYREVLPISQQENKFILGESSNIKDYVLKMQQFPQEALLSYLEEHQK